MKNLSIIALLVLFFSLNINAKDLVNLADFPKWFQKSMARETSVKTTTQLKVEAFNIDKEILGAATLIESADNFWYYNIDIGTDSPVECYIFTEFDGAANSLHAILEQGLSGVATLNKKSLASKFNFAVDTDIIGNTPFLRLDLLYILGEGNRQVTGVLKGLSAETNDSLQICMHNELGYRDTFLAVFDSFIRAFLESDKNPEFYESVYQMSLNGLPIGFGHEKYVSDQDGDVNFKTTTAMIMPVDDSSVSLTDSKSDFWSFPDGSLINGEEYSIENGELESQFSIVYQDEKWQVEGQLQGKSISKQLEHTGWLLSDYGSYIKTLQLTDSIEESANFHMWIADADPTTVQNVVISKVANNPNANFNVTLGPIDMDYFSDEKGILRQGVINLGGATLEVKLLYVKGEPSLP